MSLFHFEEHRRRGTILHGSEFTGRKRTVLAGQCKYVTHTITWLREGDNLSSKSRSPFLGVELDGGVVELRLLVLGLHTDPVWVVPQLMLL